MREFLKQCSTKMSGVQLTRTKFDLLKKEKTKMNDLQIFKNEEFGEVRTVLVDGVPFFVGKDVASILGYSNTNKAIIDHVDEEDKGVTKCDTLVGLPTEVINNGGIHKCGD